jgi:hypothetical protein
MKCRAPVPLVLACLRITRLDEERSSSVGAEDMPGISHIPEGKTLDTGSVCLCARHLSHTEMLSCCADREEARDMFFFGFNNYMHHAFPKVRALSTVQDALRVSKVMRHNLYVFYIIHARDAT